MVALPYGLFPMRFPEYNPPSSYIPMSSTLSAYILRLTGFKEISKEEWFTMTNKDKPEPSTFPGASTEQQRNY